MKTSKTHFIRGDRYMRKKIIVPTGYMGSGSSAVTDLLSEVEDVFVKNGSEEYIFMHCPDGLFDLEDKLLVGNNSLRSDEAIHRFERCMDLLYKNNGFWPGKYKKRVSENFMEYVTNFISEITIASFSDNHWYFQEEPINLSIVIRLFIYRIIKKLSFEKIKMNPPLRYNTMRLSFPTSEEYYKAANCFMNKVIEDIGADKESVVLDQLLLPHNLYRLDNYFDDDVKVIVVERDPRDVFILNKYVWGKRKKGRIPYPYNVDDFCDFYVKMRKSEIKVESENVLRIYFEDLVYQYDSTVKKIFSFLNINEEKHIHPQKMFNPNISIANTMVFKINSEYRKEISIIENKLSSYLYNFPNISIKRIEKDIF